MTKTISNFGGNISFQPAGYHRPESPNELLKILGDNPATGFRAIGSLHSWSPAAETTGIVIDMSGLTSIEVVDASDLNSPLVVVGGGCQVKHLLEHLATKGLTLPSVGLIDEQTVAGATATGTHGSGKHSLSHYIVAAEIAHFDASGKPVITKVSRGNELLAARCSLGLLGIVVSVTLQCRKQYNVSESAVAHATVASVLAEEKDFPLQQFYLMPWSWTCFAHHRKESKAPRSSLAWLYRIYCFFVIDLGLHLVVFLLAKILRVRWMVRLFFQRILPFTIIRKWTVVDDSHRQLVMEHELFQHFEIEVFVQRKDVESAACLLRDIVSEFGGGKIKDGDREIKDGDREIKDGDREIKDKEKTRSVLGEIGMLEELDRCRGMYCHHYPICFRRILPDDTLISMASPAAGECASGERDDWWAISFISYQWPGQREGFFEFAKFISKVVAKLYGGRCHWGKHNPLNRETNAQLYPRLDEFKNVVKQFDPEGRFSNVWFENVV